MASGSCILLPCHTGPHAVVSNRSVRLLVPLSYLHHGEHIDWLTQKKKSTAQFKPHNGSTHPPHPVAGCSTGNCNEDVMCPQRWMTLKS